MTQPALLRLVAYTWAIFGAYWIVFARLGRNSPTRRTQRARLLFLLATFVSLLFFHSYVSVPLLIVLCLAWAALGLHWATPPKTTSSGEHKFYRPLRLIVLALTFTLLFWNRVGIGFLGSSFLPPKTAFTLVGVGMTVLGLGLTSWARGHLGKNWSDKVVIQPDHQLISTGPYRYMRHPIYSGVLLAVAGTAVVVGKWRGVVAFLVLLTNYAIKARKEERLLAGRFGAAFDEHARRAGFLFPRFSKN
jgi:protein-S-isoprenylcysteine O-methyltransferase Ste14